MPNEVSQEASLPSINRDVSSKTKVRNLAAAVAVLGSLATAGSGAHGDNFSAATPHSSPIVEPGTMPSQADSEIYTVRGLERTDAQLLASDEAKALRETLTVCQEVTTSLINTDTPGRGTHWIADKFTPTDDTILSSLRQQRGPYGEGGPNISITLQPDGGKKVVCEFMGSVESAVSSSFTLDKDGNMTSESVSLLEPYLNEKELPSHEVIFRPVPDDQVAELLKGVTRVPGRILESGTVAKDEEWSNFTATGTDNTHQYVVTFQSSAQENNRSSAVLNITKSITNPQP